MPLSQEAEETLITCALRFYYGYAYAERRGDDQTLVTVSNRFVDSLQTSGDPLENFAAFFALQRFLYKWGGEYLKCGLRRRTERREPSWLPGPAVESSSRGVGDEGKRARFREARRVHRLSRGRTSEKSRVDGEIEMDTIRASGLFFPPVRFRLKTRDGESGVDSQAILGIGRPEGPAWFWIATGSGAPPLSNLP